MSQNALITVSDLRRLLTVGTRITLTECNFKHRFLGVPRVIVRNQSNCFAMAPLEAQNEPSRFAWMDWPRANDFYGIEPDRFRIEFNHRYFIFLIGARPLAEVIPFYLHKPKGK